MSERERERVGERVRVRERERERERERDRETQRVREGEGEREGRFTWREWLLVAHPQYIMPCAALVTASTRTWTKRPGHVSLTTQTLLNPILSLKNRANPSVCTSLVHDSPVISGYS